MAEGWKGFINSKKWHYIVDKESLCGKFMYLGQDKLLEQGNNDSPSNCAVCKRKLKRRNVVLKEIFPAK